MPSALAKSLLRMAVAAIAATYKDGDSTIFVPLRNCPKPQQAIGIDQHRGRAYCRKSGRDCPLLQMLLKGGDSILCKAAEEQERTDT